MEKLLVEGSDQSCHRVSFSGNLFLVNCQRFTAASDSEGNDVSLVSCRLSFERENKAFVKAAEASVVIGGGISPRVDVVKCECALDVRKRVVTPCILVSQKCGEGGERCRYSLLTLSSSNRLEPCFDFVLPYQLGESVSILRGPTVMWHYDGGVFYRSLQAEEVTQIPLQLSHSVLGELSLLKEQVFVLGQLNSHSTNQTLGYFVESKQVFDGSVVLPYPYIPITLCILVLWAEKQDGDEDELKSTVVAATSQQQLVYFENGVVKDTCQLPFEHPQKIQIAHTGRNGCLLAVSFHQGHVCAVWKETFQIACHWSGVSSVHVDDFLGCGSDQMLLVFKDRGVKGQPLERFLLTDLCGISYAHCQDSESPKTSPPPPENNLLTLQALESRLQTGLSVLQELEREVRVKERVLQQSVQALADVVSEREHTVTQPEQEGLIALWDCDDKSKEEASDDKTQDTPVASSKPQVDKLWHRIAEDRMIVGVILTTDSSVPVASVSLSILTETGQSSATAVIQTQSQVFCLPVPCSSSASSSSSSYTFPEPAAKRSKQHNDLNTCRLAVTAVTRLTPLLNSGCVKYSVILHYIQKQDAFSLVSNSTPFVLHCGQVALDIHSDFQTQLLKNPDLKTDDVQEDLLSLMAVLEHRVFHIDSPDYSLGDIEGWIKKRPGCKRIEVSHQYVLDSPQLSTVMLLNWHQITTFQGELSIYSSQLKMLQFFDSLLGFLPVSCLIKPAKGTRGPGVVHMFSSALEKEVVALKDSVSMLLLEGEEGEEEEDKRKCLGPIETPDLASVKGLQMCREVWQLDVERSRRRLSPLVDVGRYRRLIQRTSNVQLDGDLAALLFTQRTLLS